MLAEAIRRGMGVIGMKVCAQGRLLGPGALSMHEAMGYAAINWRVRAIRYINDKDVLKNGLPRVTYGPWSRPFQSVNPPASQQN